MLAYHSRALTPFWKDVIGRDVSRDVLVACINSVIALSGCALASWILWMCSWTLWMCSWILWMCSWTLWMCAWILWMCSWILVFVLTLALFVVTPKCKIKKQTNKQKTTLLYYKCLWRNMLGRYGTLNFISSLDFKFDVLIWVKECLYTNITI